MPRIVRKTTLRSCAVCALIGDVPSQLSTGVRSQNSDMAATTNSASALPLMPLPRSAATAPVASGTSSMPHAPCSRGMTMVRRRDVVCGADVSCHA